MSEAKSLKEAFQEMVAAIEYATLQLETTEPPGRKALSGLAREAHEALARLDESEHHWHVLEGFGVHQPDPEVIAEGNFVHQQLRRLGDPGTKDGALKDREPNLAPSGLELLAAALHPYPYSHEPEMEAS